MGEKKRRESAGYVRPVNNETSSSRDGMSVTSAATRIAALVMGQTFMPSYQEPELKADKGLFLGACNRRACQKPGATWFNRATRAYYCENCAYKINIANRDAYLHVPDVKEGEYLCIELPSD